MKTVRKTIKVSELFSGYQDKDWEGVVGYKGELDIRPVYQREFIYDMPNEQAVIATVLKGHPLNLMYWVQAAEGTYELLDGQQRTLSICRFLDHKYYIFDKDKNKVYEDTILAADREKIMNYVLDICVCEGTEGEILDWFKTINIKGKELNDQEALNATHTGEWLTDAKRYFSKPNCPAYGVGKDYIDGEVARQDYLAIALNWINNTDAQGYMALHRNDANAGELWGYFNNVIDWVKNTFVVYRKEMKGVEWGLLYNKYKGVVYDAKEIEEQILKLIYDEEVQSIKGIYTYILTGEEKHLNLRQFDDIIKRKVYEKQKHVCPHCKARGNKKQWDISEMEADHITPWHEGGKTIIKNCQILCKEHNRTKSGK